jgi:hypothetical protein
MARAYGAQTTPHMYVIDPKGTLAYMGAIDDKPSSSGVEPPMAPRAMSARPWPS